MLITTKAVAAALLIGTFSALPSPETQAAYEKKAAMEETRAACMQDKGLTYLAEPIVKHTWQPGERERLAGDYEALRAHRAKYGFGVWSKLVYPRDPAVNPVSGESVNNKNLMAMTADELKEWRAADDACFAEAAAKHLGLTVTSQRGDYLTQLNAALDTSVATLDKDKRLVRLGKRFAACLGISDTKPSALAERGRSTFTKQATQVAKKLRKSPLPKTPEGRTLALMPPLKPEQAKPYLDKEIKAALKDLECGKSFYAAYSPRAKTAKEQVYQRFAVHFAL
ncbi:hypothetical protein [Nonomuraea ceibae]|uniref:hypothetical protein n=1 Tax=Nonomuraea ceibae TaxID=1935170 RepID=UPI001C5FF0CC|nr:hypothetical protein [Nonomuraea ceibae]